MPEVMNNRTGIFSLADQHAQSNKVHVASMKKKKGKYPQLAITLVGVGRQCVPNTQTIQESRVWY